MMRTIEATIDEHGRVRLLEPVRVGRTVRALVTILEPADDLDASDELGSTALSEPALAVDWLQASEDTAWEHLQPER